MTQAELVKFLAKGTDLKQRDIEAVLELLVQEIKSALSNNEEFKMPGGIGKFYMKEVNATPEKQMMNYLTNKMCTVEAKPDMYVPGFKTNKKFRTEMSVPFLRKEVE